MLIFEIVVMDKKDKTEMPLDSLPSFWCAMKIFGSNQ